MDLPPIFPCMDDELRKFLLDLDKLAIHNTPELLPWKPNPMELLATHGPSEPTTTLMPRRDVRSGKILGFKEVAIKTPGADATNSMSMTRKPAPPVNSLFGNPAYVPFWPGSFEAPKPADSAISPFDKEKLLTVPPGFHRGLTFAEDGHTVDKSEKKNVIHLDPNDFEHAIDLHNLLKDEKESLGIGAWSKKQNKEELPAGNSSVTFNPREMSPEVEELEKHLLGQEEPVVLKISKLKPLNALRSTEWAILLDTSQPVKNFHERIPPMPIQFGFELDNFQKLAILQLEAHNHVFVAAHTSAGKTVVAEYAIALSQKHKTKAVYTSPIKALSNQKYRDFKARFDDVGLITGDFQINPTASCLIMTTEILRSMLYCGSDIARDLEFVIFDEVHYVNDRERGHVWEQVLIMLPARVCVVLLSATVPNTIEFADWLGRTHKRKVYVVTTYKRPVPLQHYLYTGKGGSTRDNRFNILDADTWISHGYAKAMDSVKDMKGRDADGMYQRLNPAQEKTLWSGLISHLKKQDLLPVVAFTFSRQKCDNNAVNLTNLDFTTDKEKTHIIMFFNKCIGCLKDYDQEIPQILKMRDILSRGIGVHHSGILPIIKEIVEMLFQRGDLKLLFATETFAMGVNMPARTVVFDSVKKHDGTELRELEPAEYIQMAGRAGRRGLDEEGTVLILCKNGFIPPEETLKKMMLGKPSSLVSQFRLTYGMVLSLLRVESLSVEGMMMLSFGEADHHKQLANLKSELKKVEKSLEEVSSQQLSNYLLPLVTFYNNADDYLRAREKVMDMALSSRKAQKVLVPGRLLVVSTKNHNNKLAIILSSKYGKQITFRVLVLTDPSQQLSDMENISWFHMIGLAQERLFLPIGSIGHELLTVSPLDIFEICKNTIKTNPSLVIQDYEKRQMDRFKDDPPGKTCLEAVQELHKLSMLVNSDTKLQYLDLIRDFEDTDLTCHDALSEMYHAKAWMMADMNFTKIPNFEHQFSAVFRRKHLEGKKMDLEFKLSHASLTLYPDYENRITLLKKLRYIDNENRVQLKGQVACRIGMNEVLITELVLRNVFTRLKPAEVAALLTPLVYRGRSTMSWNMESDVVPRSLKDAITDIKKVYEEIQEEERDLGIQTQEFQEDLNFDMVQVVYEWALGKPFADIMYLTDIQEGIVVRCIQQLNETICDVREAARIIGDPELYNKMQQASTSIRRDIVLTESLYTFDLIAP